MRCCSRRRSKFWQTNMKEIIQRVVLPASVILNLFLLAVIGGHVWRAHTRGEIPGSGMALARALTRVEAILPAEDSAAFSQVIRRDAPHFSTSVVQLRRARQELDRQIAADPFNPAAARQALSATQVAWNHFLDDFGGTLIDALSQVSPQGRRKLISETQFGARVSPGPP